MKRLEIREQSLYPVLSHAVIIYSQHSQQEIIKIINDDDFYSFIQLDGDNKAHLFFNCGLDIARDLAYRFGVESFILKKFRTSDIKNSLFKIEEDMYKKDRSYKFQQDNNSTEFENQIATKFKEFFSVYSEDDLKKWIRLKKELKEVTGARNKWILYLSIRNIHKKYNYGSKQL